MPRSKKPLSLTVLARIIEFNSEARERVAELLNREGELLEVDGKLLDQCTLAPLYDELEDLLSDFPQFSEIDRKYHAENYLAAINPLERVVSELTASEPGKDTRSENKLIKIIRSLDPNTQSLITSALNGLINESKSDVVAQIKAARKGVGFISPFAEGQKTLADPMPNIHRIHKVLLDLISNLSEESDSKETRGRPFQDARMVIICCLLDVFESNKAYIDHEAVDLENKLEFIGVLLDFAGIPWPKKRDKRLSLIEDAVRRLDGLSDFRRGHVT